MSVAGAGRGALTLFDLDATLLPIDSDHGWCEFMVELGWVEGEAFRSANDRFYAAYLAGRHDIHAYIGFATAPLLARSDAELRAGYARFMREVIEPAIRPQALALVDSHRARGDRLAIVTSTHELIVAPIVTAFGLDPVEQMIATRLARDAQGRLTGTIDGVAAFRDGKVARVGQWLARSGETPGDFDAVVVYSDSPNDLPLLEMATEPVATNPSADLAAIARARGWKILNLFA